MKKKKLVMLLLVSSVFLGLPSLAYAETTDGTATAQANYLSSSLVALKQGLVTENDGYTYYYRWDGSIGKGLVEAGNGRKYLTDKDGHVYSQGWHEANPSGTGAAWYYVNADRTVQTGWLTLGNDKYYFDDYGRMKTGMFGAYDEKGHDYHYYLADKNGRIYTKGWYHLNTDGTGEATYYVKDDRTLQTGWLTLGDDKYYFGSDGKMKTGKFWAYDEKGLAEHYYLADENGRVYTKGWYYLNLHEDLYGAGWYYVNDDRTLQTGWLTLGNDKYYFGDYEKMETGKFRAYDEKRLAEHYYLADENGHVYTKGWYHLNTDGTEEDTYYVNDDRTLQTGWLTLGDDKYYFESDGKMETGRFYAYDEKRLAEHYYLADVNGHVSPKGWYQADPYNSGDVAWYYGNEDGSIVTGWQKINNIWYYFIGDGEMVTGWQNISGVWYYFAGSGAMVTGWQNISGVWYYFAGSGAMVTGWQNISGVWYYFAGSGAMACNEYRGGYWMNGSGSWTYPYLASWRLSNGRWWYGDNTGWYAANQTLRIDGTTYRFNANGYIY